ncbi:MAG: aminotransferase class III-fold pyridoxal phosphate-dependent enzyme, partial [Alphaproteobacteria bacterium]|nr:aminotransferase class III-fold pyridoxal phosphate-dependent enzyme [Alphaproteobacteria bacterium]
RSAYLDAALVGLWKAFPAHIAELRGRGLMRGIKLAAGIDVGMVVGRVRDQHVLTVPAAENTLRLLPPLIISRDEIDLAVNTIGDVLGAIDPPQSP